jgi:hypothetical protein
MTETFKKGDFAVGRVGVCRFLDDPEHGIHIEFVSNYESGVGITCGGGRMGGSIDEFAPLSTTEHFILSRAYAAMKARDDAKVEAARQDEIFKVHAAALKALKDAERASATAKGGTV